MSTSFDDPSIDPIKAEQADEPKGRKRKSAEQEVPASARTEGEASLRAGTTPANGARKGTSISLGGESSSKRRKADPVPFAASPDTRIDKSKNSAKLPADSTMKTSKSQSPRTKSKSPATATEKRGSGKKQQVSSATKNIAQSVHVNGKAKKKRSSELSSAQSSSTKKSSKKKDKAAKKKKSKKDAKKKKKRGVESSSPGSTDGRVLYEGLIENLESETQQKRCVEPLLEALHEANLPGSLIHAMSIRVFRFGPKYRAEYCLPHSNEWLTLEETVTRLGATLPPGDDGAGRKRAKASRKPQEEEFGVEMDLVPNAVVKSSHAEKLSKVASDQIKLMGETVEKLLRMDEHRHFTGDASGRRHGSNRTELPRMEASAGPLITLYDLMRKVRAGEYVDYESERVVSWDQFCEDLTTLLDARVEIWKELGAAVTASAFGSSEDARIEDVAQRFKEWADKRRVVASAVLEEDLSRLKRLELLESLGPNNEPAMPVWRKELLKAYPYRNLQAYEPAQGLLPEERDQVLAKLKDSSERGNRWVHPEGLDMLPLWLKVVALDRGDNPSKPIPRMEDALPASSIREQPTWGIDCFARRNVESALVAKGYSLEQIRYFVESNLLRALNAVRPIEAGWDMTQALTNIIAEIDMQLKEQSSTDGAKTEPNGEMEVEDTTSEKESSSSRTGTETRELMYARVKVTKQGKSRSGRIIGFRPPTEYNIMYDDDHINTFWENLASKRSYEVLDLPIMTDPYKPLQPEEVRAVATLLLDHIAKHPRQFAVHSKGTGVVTQQPILVGRLIQKYTGLLYPCWLWEEKESKEDDERLQHKRETGEVILPDFWNMRLELPKGQDEQGLDLLHVDAKLAGNFSSRMSHSCRPNCGTMTAVIDGEYCVGMRALRDIAAGEELTIDYNCVTDSLDEYRAAICLCGAHDCRGSFLYIIPGGGDPQQKSLDIVDRSQGPLHRVAMLFSACYENGELERAFGTEFTECWPRWVSAEERQAAIARAAATVQLNSRGNKRKAVPGAPGRALASSAAGRVSEELPPNEEEQPHTSEAESEAIVKAILSERGFGTRALGSLPSWALRFAAHVVEFIECEELERTRTEFSRRRQTAVKVHEDNVWRISELESKGLADQRVTNLVIALDKARHHMCERLTKTPTVDEVGSSLGDVSDRSRLRERWWVSDRCFARWVGDDAAEFPDWYEAEVVHVFVKQQELRVLYDTQEINQIPFSMARRPACDEIVPPHTGCDVMNHQPPFRVLSEPAVAHFLLTDTTSGICARLLVCVKEAYLTKGVALWQSAMDDATRKPYWWNFQTREIKQMRPSEKDLQKRMPYEPKALQQLTKVFSDRVEAVQRLCEDDNTSAGETARKAVAQLRDILLRMPVPSGEPRLADMNQKAADLLTLLSVTRNFFTLYEPESDTTNSHAVINALTSWVNQGLELRMPDITEMIGTALLPPIERAYNESCGLGYCGALRTQLCSHLRQAELKDWPRQVVSMFPKASEVPPQPVDADKSWPYPVPPVRLFGTPALDSAIYDHLDYTKTCALMKHLHAKREPGGRNEISFKPERGSKNLREVAALLREKTLDRSKVDSEDQRKVEPPKLPAQAEWVQCERPECQKWRKLPVEINVKTDIPTPFFCEALSKLGIDPAHGNCAAEEEQEQGTIVISDNAVVDLGSLRAGELVDAFDQFSSEWRMAAVLETNESSIKIKYHAPTNSNGALPQIEWISKQPDTTLTFSRIARVNTYTVPAPVRRAYGTGSGAHRAHRAAASAGALARAHHHPYQTLVPDADPEVARCLHGLVFKVEEQVLGPLARSKQVGTSRLELVLKLEQMGFSTEWDHNTKNGFSQFFACHRELDPHVPFVTLLARWSVLDPEQRQAWLVKDDHKLIAAPGLQRVFEGPGFLPPSSAKKTIVRCVEMPRKSAPATFVGETDIATFGMPIETAFGRGFVVSTKDATVEIALEWGAKLFVPRERFRVEVPLSLACPKPVSTRGGYRKRVKVEGAFAVPLPTLAKKQKRPYTRRVGGMQSESTDAAKTGLETEEDPLPPYPDAPTAETEALIRSWSHHWMHVQSEDGIFVATDGPARPPQVRVYAAGGDEEPESSGGEDEENQGANDDALRELNLPEHAPYAQSVQPLPQRALVVPPPPARVPSPHQTQDADVPFPGGYSGGMLVPPPASMPHPPAMGEMGPRGSTGSPGRGGPVIQSRRPHQRVAQMEFREPEPAMGMYSSAIMQQNSGRVSYSDHQQLSPMPRHLSPHPLQQQQPMYNQGPRPSAAPSAYFAGGPMPVRAQQGQYGQRVSPPEVRPMRATGAYHHPHQQQQHQPGMYATIAGLDYGVSMQQHQHHGAVARSPPQPPYASSPGAGPRGPYQQHTSPLPVRYPGSPAEWQQAQANCGIGFTAGRLRTAGAQQQLAQTVAAVLPLPVVPGQAGTSDPEADQTLLDGLDLIK